MADLEERQALLAELRDANDARAKTMYDETGKSRWRTRRTPRRSPWPRSATAR